MPEEIMLKTYEADVKAIEGERAFNVTITTTKKDRDGDIVEAKGAKLANYRRNPVVLMAHDYRGLAIAKTEKIDKEDEKIKAKITFPPEGDYPLADIVHRLYKGKFMRAWSIGFIPIKSEDIVDEDDDDKGKADIIRRGRRIKTWELLEFSACAIPSNPEALTNMVAKGINIEPLKEAGFIEIEDEKAKYKCECIKCGYKMTSDKHCKEIKCPKCGGTMRRVERPGPGEETNMTEGVITKPEETDDLIRIPAKGEEGKHKGHKIRWITVSAKEGIKGIYCIDCKKIITFVFDKKKGWTMEKAKKWMADHGKAISDYIKGAEEEELEEYEKGKEDIDIDAAMILKATKDDIKELDNVITKFAGSPRNPFGSHCSFRFKGGSAGYKKAWTIHCSQINGGALTPAASGPIRGTVRRIAMIAAGMKPPCSVTESEGMGPRKGPKSPLPGSYPQRPSDYGLSSWLTPSDEDVDADQALRFTCSDLNTIKRICVLEIKRRIKDREAEEEGKGISAEEEEFFEGLEDLESMQEIANNEEIENLNIEIEELKEKIKDIELKAGAVLNAKNKKNLKDAQALIQSVLDSATTGEEEDSLEIEDEKGEDNKGDNTVIDLETDGVDDVVKDEEKDEDAIEVDEKVIAETIEKHMNYLVGKLDKSDT